MIKKATTLLLLVSGIFVVSAQAKDYGSIFYSDDAERYLEKWNSDKSWSEEALKAQAAYNRQEYTQALKYYKSAFDLGYKSGQGAFNMGDCHEHMGQLSLAVKAYEETLKTANPFNKELLFKANYRLGALEAEKKNWEKAYEYFEAARQINPNDADLLLNLGVACQKQQHWSEAKKLYEAALGLNPKLKEAQKYLDNLNARRNLPQVIVSKPVLKQKLPLTLTSINSLKKENIKNKIKELNEELSAAEPNRAEEIQYELGLYYYTAGQFDQAIEHLNQAKKVAPETYFILGLLYFKSGDVAQGIKAYHQYIRKNPKDPLVHYNLATIYDNELNKKKKAIHHYRRYLYLAKENAKDADDVGRRIWILSNYRNP